MGLMSKIAESRIGKVAAISMGTGAAFIPTSEMLNPPAVYAHTDDIKKRASELIDELVNLSDYINDNPLAKGALRNDPEYNEFYKREKARGLINWFTKKNYGSTFQIRPGTTGSVSGGSILPGKICEPLETLYQAAQSKFGKELGVKAHQNPGLGQLVNMYNACKQM